MPTCPDGHESSATDYCDTCGLVLGGAPPAPAIPDPSPAPVAAASPSSSEGLVCAACGEPREGRFCEECGHDNDLPLPATPAAAAASPAPATPASPVSSSGPRHAAGGWTAVVRADRDWFEEVRRRDGPDAATLEFPRDAQELRFTLTGPQMAIGRRSRSRGTDPEIDLGPSDPGVSAGHALLVARPDGDWEIVDVGSTNGTAVGDSTDPITPHVGVPLADGDRIRLGAWTTITVEGRSA